MANPKSKPKLEVATPDEDTGYPRGWTVTDIGGEGYLVEHDGTKEDGSQPDGGCAFKVHDPDDVDLVIAHRGQVPE